MARSASSDVRIEVLIPGLLRSYTDGVATVKLEVASPPGAAVPSLGDALAALDARYPGFRFRVVDEQGRIRPHIRMFLDRDEARNLAAQLSAGKSLMIVGALSGG